MKEPDTLKQNEVETERLIGSRTEKINTLGEELEAYKKRYNRIMLIVSSTFALAMLLILIVLLWEDLVSIYRVSIRPVFQYWPNVLAVIAVPVVALNLYNLKRYRKVHFVVLEFGVALVSTWAGLNKLMAASYELGTLLLIAGVCLATHGIENFLGARSDNRAN